MALSATTIWEVETVGSDTANGGAFDPGQTAGMFTDGAATSANTTAPVFTSASYNFVAGDVSAWVFVASGTNWTPGWYLIASVAANAATLNATIGSAVVSTGAANTSVSIGLRPSVVTGCATVASPTGATWSIDYSQQAAVKNTYTDLASAGTGLTVSSVALPFGRQQVGNSLVITGGTNFNTGRYVIASVAAVTFVATVVGAGNITTGAGVTGTGGLGGALASLGKAGAHIVGTNQLFQKTGTYTITSASTNVAAGCVSVNLVSLLLTGYDTVRGDLNPIGAAGTRPTNVASGISTFTMFNTNTGTNTIRNIILDGATLTASRGFNGSSQTVNCLAQNFTNTGFYSSVQSATFIRCVATGCTTAGAGFLGPTIFYACEAFSNSVPGFSAGTNAACEFVDCLSYNNTGASSDGFLLDGVRITATKCVAYGNGRDGFRMTAAGGTVINCAAEGNTGAGFTVNTVNLQVIHCATYNNTGGAIVSTGATHFMSLNPITGTASFFTNAAGADFSLNTTSGGGALLRAAGYPGVFPGGLTTGYLDVGAVQHADPAAGGGQGVSQGLHGIETGIAA